VAVLTVSVTLEVRKIVLPPWLLTIEELEAVLLVLTGNDVAKPPPVDVV
jgi:hypothetical protein